MLKRLWKSKLLGNTAIYGLANVLNGAIPFLLLPILTRVFTPEEYGLITLVSAVIAIMGAFTGLSAHGAVSVKYFDKSIDHPQFVGASLLVLIGSTAFILILLFFTGDAISNWVNLPKEWLFIAAIASSSQFVINVRLVLWQVKDQPIRYGLFQVSQTLFNLGLSLALVFWAIWGWQGRTWGIALASIIFCVIAVASMQKAKLVHWKRNFRYERDVIAFGFPLIPHVLGGFAIAMSDRFILTSLLGVNAVGHYAVGIQMAMVIGVLTDAFSKAYSPHLYRVLNCNEKKINNEKLVKNSYFLFFCFICLSWLYSILLSWLYPVLIGDLFQDSLTVAKISTIAFAFQGMYYTMVNFIFFYEKTGALSLISSFCGIVNIILAYAFVSKFGVIGASYAFLISQLLIFIGVLTVTQRIHPLPWFRVLFATKKI